MPFLDPTPGAADYRVPGGENPEASPTGSVLAAAARTENTLVSAYNYLTERTGFAHDPDHNPIDVIKGTKYEASYLHRFVDSASEADTRARMSRIDREEEDRRILDHAGTAGLAAQVGMGLLDPTLFIPLGTIYRGAKIGRAALKSAGATGLAAGAMVAGQEAVLYSTQETRSGLESTANVATGTILGGLLGGAIGGMTSRELAHLTDVMDGFRKEVNTEFRANDAGAASALREGLTLAPAGGAEGAAAPLSPVTRLQTSPFEAARATIRDLADAGLSYRENLDGVPTSEGGTVETRAKLRRGPLINTIGEMDDAFARYYFGKPAVGFFEKRSAALRSTWANWTGQNGGKLTQREFREEIGKAMRRGDEHPIPEVAEAAAAFRKNVFDPLKEEAIKHKVPGFTEDMGTVGAETYFSRVYNREKIIAKRDEWNQILVDHLDRNNKQSLAKFEEKRAADLEKLAKKQADLEARIAKLSAKETPTKSEQSMLVARQSQLENLLERIENVKTRRHDAEDMTPGQIRTTAEEITNTILGESVLRLPGLSLLQGPKGPLMRRVFVIPDSAIEDFLESDVEKVARVYTHSMSGDLELMAKFGDVKLEGVLTRLREEFDAADRNIPAGAEKKRTALRNRFEADKRDLEALRDRVRGNYAVPDNPDGLLYRAGRVALSLNYLARLGGVTISALPDTARPIMRYGLTSTFRDGWLPLIRDLNTFKLAAKELRMAGTALDMVRDQRALELADLMDDYGRGHKLERGVQWMADRFSIMNLMSPWNAGAKTLAGVVTMAHAVRAARNVALGKASAKEIDKLAQNGIDAAMAKRIWAETEKSGNDVNGVMLPNTEDWTDLKAVEAFRALLNRETETLIVTPGLERPLFMSKTWGRLIGQFKTFSMVATQRMTLAGLQQRDASVLAGVLTSLAFGAVSAKIKAELRGQGTDSWTPAQWTAEALDNSGLLGILMEANGMAEKVTRGRVGLSVITGKEVSRFASRNAIGSLFGPTADFASDAATLGALGADDWSRADTRALRKIVPFQNLAYLRGLFDMVEEGVNDHFNIPARRRQ